MFQLRRAAVRAISQQPCRHLSTFRSTTSNRVTLLQSSKPTLYRPFHQTRIWRADEQDTKPEEVTPAQAETAGETVPPEPVSQEAEELRTAEPEATQGEADVAGASAGGDSAQPADFEAESGTDKVAEAASATAQAAASTASAVATDAAAATGMPPPPSPFDAPTARNARPSRILYVGNLFFEVTAPQLEQEFARFGEITNSRVVTDARGLSKGFGYVEFADQEAADRAVRDTDQRVFQGRRMAVQYHVQRQPRPGGAQGRSRPQNPPSKTLFIGNMSYQMSDRDLNDLFREIRDVLDVRVAIDRRSGQPRGFAHADFIDIPSAQRAKEHLEKKVVYGRQLRVDFSMQSGGNAGVEGT